MVAEGGGVLPALAPLAVLLQEVRDHAQRRLGAVASLQPQPEDQRSHQVTPETKRFMGESHNVCGSCHDSVSPHFSELEFISFSCKSVFKTRKKPFYKLHTWVQMLAGYY